MVCWTLHVYYTNGSFTVLINTYVNRTSSLDSVDPLLDTQPTPLSGILLTRPFRHFTVSLLQHKANGNTFSFQTLNLPSGIAFLIKTTIRHRNGRFLYSKGFQQSQTCKPKRKFNKRKKSFARNLAECKCKPYITPSRPKRFCTCLFSVSYSFFRAFR